MKYIILAVSYLLLCSTTALAAIPASVTSILKEKNIPDSSLSVIVQEIASSQPIINHNTDIPLNPASVMKLVTTYAGLEILGPDYRWKTDFYLDGQLQNGVLHGNLIVKGHGDPYIVEETLLPMLRVLRQKGLKHIEGNLVIDNSYFVPAEQDPGDFDNKPYRVYNALPSALMMNFQATRFTITPDTLLGKIQIEAWPHTPELNIVNEMKLVKGTCKGGHRWPKMWFMNEPNGLVARFKGNYSAACGQHEINRAIAKPAALFYGAFVPAWRYLGGTLKGTYREGTTTSAHKLLHSHDSRPLTEIISLINKFSNNVMTRHLLLTIGAETYGEPGTLKKGRRAIVEWMHSQDISTRGFHIDNGSGLSRDSRITGLTLSQLASHQWKSPWMAEMLSSLSILSVDGTGKKRFKDSPLSGTLHFKTGLLDHVRSMAGIFQGENGKRYVIICLQNHHNIHKLTGTRIQNALLEWLDENSRR